MPPRRRSKIAAKAFRLKKKISAHMKEKIVWIKCWERKCIYFKNQWLCFDKINRLKLYVRKKNFLHHFYKRRNFSIWNPCLSLKLYHTFLFSDMMLQKLMIIFLHHVCQSLETTLKKSWFGLICLESAWDELKLSIFFDDLNSYQKCDLNHTTQNCSKLFL